MKVNYVPGKQNKGTFSQKNISQGLNTEVTGYNLAL
jgi:hypothetical protein